MADKEQTPKSSRVGKRVGTPHEGTRGTLPYEPTDEIADEVEVFARLGLTNSQIGEYFKLADSTLRKYYGHKLQSGRINGVKFAAEKLQEKVKEGNLTAIIFYLKTRGSFLEVRGHQMLDKNNEPTHPELDLSHATDLELRVLKKFLSQFIPTEPNSKKT